MKSRMYDIKLHFVRTRIYLVLMLLLCFHDAFSQDVVPTKGTEFWVGFMENHEIEPTESLDLFITSDVNTSGTVSIPLQGWSQSFSVVANITTTVTVPNNLAEHLNENQLVSSRGILVETEDISSVFAINFNLLTADGTKILPIQSLGTEYRVISYSGVSGSPEYGSALLVVATEDDTEIEIIPSVATQNGNPAGVPFNVQLNRGESYQIIQYSDSEDLTGTIVKSTEDSGTCRPFAVFSGASCATIPAACPACDHIFEQNFSVETWGTEYYLVPYEFASSYTYRVMAHEDNTQVIVNNDPPFILNAGEYQEYNSESSVVCVNTSAPSLVAQFMQGVICSGAGDPAMLILNDASQKINNVTFSTVVSGLITDHGLNVIVRSEDISSLSLDGAYVDQSVFSVFPSCPSHSYAQLNILEGSHTLDAPNGFTAYVFGTGVSESYSYSVGSFSSETSILEDIEESYCSNSQVILAIQEPGNNTVWYNLDFPEDTLEWGDQYVLNPPIVSGVYVGAYESPISGCEQQEVFSVEVPTPPVLILLPSLEICQYESVALDLQVAPESSFYNYSWTPAIGLSDPNIRNPIASPLSTTTYQVEVSSPTGCSASSIASVEVVVSNGQLSNINAAANFYEICQGDQVQLSLAINELTFQDNFDPGISWGLWEDIENGSQGSLCGSISGNALYFNGAGQRVAQTIPVDVSTGGYVSFALQYGDGAFPCDIPEVGEDVILEYSLNNAAWTSIQTFFSVVVSGWNQYTIEIPVGAIGPATYFRWRQLSSSGNNEDNWSLDNVAVSVLSDSMLEYDWSPAIDFLTDNAIENPIVAPSQDQSYYVEVTDLSTGCTYIDSLSIDVGQSFNLEITADTTLCGSTPLQLEVIPSIDEVFTYLWFYDNGTISSVFSDSPIVEPAETSTYRVEVTSSQGCVNTEQVDVIVSQPLSVSVTADDMEICLGDQTIVHANVTGNPDDIKYEWSSLSNISDLNSKDPSVQPTSTDIFEVLVTDTISGCVSTGQIQIEVKGDFSIEASLDIVTCDAVGIGLTATPSVAGSYDWTWEPSAEVIDSNSQNTQIVNNTSNEFVVTASEDGCEQTDTVDVLVIFQDFDLGEDLEICEGEQVTLDTGYPDANNEWNTQQFTSSIIASEERMYVVEITSDLGCSVMDSLYLYVSPIPQVNLGPDQTICEGEEVELIAGVGIGDISWNTGPSSESIVVTTSGIYSVVVVNDDNCSNSDEVLVQFSPLPSSDLLDRITKCFAADDEQIVLDVTNVGSTYLWNTGANSSSIVATVPGIYSVDITSAFGCVSTISTEVVDACFGSYLYVPNSFTPNGDGKNEVWKAEGAFVADFEIQVFDRWGEVVFSSNDINESWIGNDEKGSHYVPVDSYSYFIRYKYIRDAAGTLSDWVIKAGQVSIIR